MSCVAIGISCYALGFAVASLLAFIVFGRRS